MGERVTPIFAEKCDRGIWSLEITFGKGEHPREVMRCTSDFLRGLFKVDEARPAPAKDEA